MKLLALLTAVTMMLGGVIAKKQPHILFVLAGKHHRSSTSAAGCSPSALLLRVRSSTPLTPLSPRADDYGWNDIGYHTNHSAVGYLNSANPTKELTSNAAAGVMVRAAAHRRAPMCAAARC